MLADAVAHFAFHTSDRRLLARNPETGGIGLTELVLDERSFRLTADADVRRHGTACLVSAWKRREDVAGPPNLHLKLIEFPDPGGTASYFLPRDSGRRQQTR